MTDVSCVRCHATVPAAQTDCCVDGMVCRNCMAKAATGGRDVAVLESELSRATARKEIITGLVLLVLGIGIFSVGSASIGGNRVVVMVPLGMIVGGAVELFRGLTRNTQPPRR